MTATLEKMRHTGKAHATGGRTMRTMKAEHFSGYSALKLVELPRPEVSDGKVSLRLTAVGVTLLEHMILSGASLREGAARPGQRRCRRGGGWWRHRLSGRVAGPSPPHVRSGSKADSPLAVGDSRDENQVEATCVRRMSSTHVPMHPPASAGSPGRQRADTSLRPAAARPR